VTLCLFGGMLRRIATLPVPAGQAARRAQEIFGDEIGREKCLRNRLDQRHFWWLRGRETLNRPPPEAAGSTVAQNRAKTLRREAA